MKSDLSIRSATLMTLAAGQFAGRVPGLRRVPMLQVIVLGQMVLLARDHLERLTPRERHRVVVLVRGCKGRVSQLSDNERLELQTLIGKIEPRLFAETAARTLSPLPLPGRVRRRW
jgi:hypothetical protein